MGNENTKEIDLAQPDGKIHEKCENGGVNGISLTITANGYTVDVPPKTPIENTKEPPSPEVKTESTEYVVLESQSGPTEAEAPVQTPEPSVLSEVVPPKEEKVSLFSKMFKKKTEKEPQEELNEDQAERKPGNDQQVPNGKIHEKQDNGTVNKITANDPEIQVPPTVVMEQSVQTHSTEYVVLESQSGSTEAEDPDASVRSEEVSPREERVSLFSKMFKKKITPTTEKEIEKPKEEQTDMSPAIDHQQESDHLKPDFEQEKAEEGDSGPEQTEEQESELDRGSGNIIVESQDSPEEENPVMNFFKTLIAPTKTSKKEAPVSVAPKDQPKPPENQPAPATTITTVAQVSDPPAAPKGMPAPPPPPPEPPRAEPAAKAAKKEEPKPAAKDTPKGKSSTLTKLFRSKKKHKDPHPSVEEAQTANVKQENPVEEPQPAPQDQTDSHVDTQETAEVPQSVVTEDQEQKPDASKASTLEAAAKPAPAPAAAQEEKKPEAKKSLFSFLKPKAAEPKAAPAQAGAAAEPGPAKEDAPKAAKSTEATAEAKPATAAPSGGEDVASAPKKMEKRNSITLFFKNLSQKRPSTDAAAQTEAAPSAEKTK